MANCCHVLESSRVRRFHVVDDSNGGCALFQLQFVAVLVVFLRNKVDDDDDGTASPLSEIKDGDGRRLYLHL